MKNLNLKDLLHNVTTQLRDLSTLEKPDFRLELAVYNEEEGIWEVVISYLLENNNKPLNPIQVFTSQTPYQRVYKKVIVNNDGQLMEFLMFDTVK